ncbi:hypothetical protein [Scytonema sp. PCC 10023]|uniref:hypothetical protein n=1 Tax=Scytonema sp. PCC 10023 TaxID=1680591 RepID=UPI0039C6BFFA
MFKLIFRNKALLLPETAIAAARPMPQPSSAWLPRIGDSRRGFLLETLWAYTGDRCGARHLAVSWME